MNNQIITFKKDEVIVLLGAGASVDAGIPHSAAMVQQIEEALKKDWAAFKDLYNYVRSAIFYADGIQGTFNDRVPYNIERLVIALEELSRREEHPIYPFIGAWNPRLTQVAGENFDRVSQFKQKILEKLRHEWIELPDYNTASYFKGLINFQKELNYPLRVFTLNYDLCVEKAYQCDYNEFPERGFDKSSRIWSHELLEEGSPADKNLYLYKLHGSIDWLWNQEKKLTFSDSTSKIKVEDGALIFGISSKLQYVDPFLFLVYQLRRFSLDAKLLITIGYGFGDEHINGVLGQALRGDQTKRLVAVNWENDQSSFRQYVSKQLDFATPDDQRLVVKFSKAVDFLSRELSLEAMGSSFPPEEAIFDEVASGG